MTTQIPIHKGVQKGGGAAEGRPAPFWEAAEGRLPHGWVFAWP